MTMSFKILLLSTTIYVGLNAFPAVHANSEDEQPQPQHQVLKKRVIQEGNPPKRVRKNSRAGAPQAEQPADKARKAPLKNTQASKRQKTQNDTPVDVSTWEGLKAALASTSPKNKKLGKQALQQMADDINHPQHAKAVKLALDKKIMKPGIALEKFEAILNSAATTLDQKEVALVYFLNHKILHDKGVSWLDKIIEATPAVDPNRHRLGLLYFREVPYQARSVYRAVVEYSVLGRGQDIILEILKNPNHPLFIEACRKAFIGRVYYVDQPKEFAETYPAALKALKEKASDPMDPDHLEALLALIIGNDKDSLLDPEECMSELVLGHLKPLWTPNRPQYVRITEYLFFYGDEDSRREALPILLDNIRKGNYTKELKKASGSKMPGNDLQNTQIKQALADSKKRSQNQNLAEEDAQPEASPQPQVSPPQPTDALFEDCLMNLLTHCLNNPRKIKTGLRRALTKPGLTYSVLMAKANNEEERGLQKKLYKIVRPDLDSKLGTKDTYLFIKKFGDSNDCLDFLKAKVNKYKEILDKNKFVTPSGYNALLKRKNWKNIWGLGIDMIELDIKLGSLAEIVTDPEEEQLLVTLSQYGALVSVYKSWGNWGREKVKALESLAESNSPYALDAIRILASHFGKSTKNDDASGRYMQLFERNTKYGEAYRRIIESPDHPDRVKALLNYALIDREYAQKNYLRLIEELFHATDERSDPLLKSDTAAVAHFLETTDSALLSWREAQSPFNEEGVFQNNFPTQFPYLWVDLHPKALSEFLSVRDEYCETVLHIDPRNLDRFLEIAEQLSLFKKRVQEARPELNTLVDAGNFQELWKHSIWKGALNPGVPKEIKDYANRLVGELGAKVFDKALDNALPEIDNLLSLPVTREKLNAFLSLKIWSYGLNNNSKNIYVKTIRTFVDKLSLSYLVRTKFLEEAPQQLPLIEWEDSLVKDRIMSLVAKINKEDEKHPEFYDLRSLLDYKSGSWEKSNYRWDYETQSPKTETQGWDLLTRQTEATLKKLLNIPLTEEEALVASPHTILAEDKPAFINAFKHAIEYMENMDDPSLRNVTLGLIVRGLLFCDAGQTEAINTAVLNLVFKKQRLSSDFSHQLAGVMHEVVAGAFDLASAQPMQGQTDYGTHFQGQLRDVLHPYIGLPQVIAGHTERYTKIKSAHYLFSLIAHFERQMPVKHTIDTILKMAQDDKKFNYGLLGDVQVWLDSIKKQFSDYGFNEEDAENIKLTPQLLIDYLIAKGWLKAPAFQGSQAMAPAEQAQAPVVQAQNPVEQVQNPAEQVQQNPGGV